MNRKAFTLIELLIGVAIIAILAAIAVPNFLEAQIRAKTSRVKADMRSMATAIEAYRVDNNKYPLGTVNPNTHPLLGKTPASLTTPVAYLTSLMTDVFAIAVNNPHPDPDKRQPNPLHLFEYTSRETWGSRFGSTEEWDRYGPGETISWALNSRGPDSYTEVHEPGLNAWHGNFLELFQARANAASSTSWYDPTNGSVSKGDIIGYGPGPRYDIPSLTPVRP